MKKGERQILVFNLMGEELAIDISYVLEVLKPREIHSLPKAPAFIDGVINLRNHVIAVMDLRKRFDLQPQGNSPMTRIIICRVKKFIVGLIVDSVSEVMKLTGKNIDPTPEVISAQVGTEYVCGIARAGERVITLLDLEKILTRKETDKLSEIGK